MFIIFEKITFIPIFSYFIIGVWFARNSSWTEWFLQTLWEQKQFDKDKLELISKMVKNSGSIMMELSRDVSPTRINTLIAYMKDKLIKTLICLKKIYLKMRV